MKRAFLFLILLSATVFTSCDPQGDEIFGDAGEPTLNTTTTGGTDDDPEGTVPPPGV